MSLSLKLEEFFNGKINKEGLLCRREIEYSSYEHIADIVNDSEDKSDSYQYRGIDANKFSTQFSHLRPVYHIGYYRRHLNNQTSLTIHNRCHTLFSQQNLKLYREKCLTLIQKLESLLIIQHMFTLLN